MSALGIDIAWARPTVAQIKATGARWVARYLSTDSSKNLTASEVRAYSAAGIGTVVVWETTTGRATAGYAAGQADARAAEAQRAADGLPAEMDIHFAVDEDTGWSSVAQYFAGVASVLGHARVGVYGGFAVIEGAYAAGFRLLWQTTAWSGGRWSAHATIRQTGGTLLGGGADVDYAEVADFGEYPRPTSTPTVPTTPPEEVVTEAEIDAVATSVVAKMLTGASGGAFDRDLLAGTTVYWLRRALDPSIPLPKGTNLPPVVAEVAGLRASLVAREAANTAAIAALTKALGSGGGITAAQVQAAAQAGAAAALAELGHALDSTK